MDSNINLSRLDRIEQKIDKLTDTMISLARLEEKLVAIEVARNYQEEINNDLEGRVENLEIRTRDTEGTVSAINKIFWILVTAGLVAIVGRYVASLFQATGNII
jgi:CHASE3 domain sensor protein